MSNEREETFQLTLADERVVTLKIRPNKKRNDWLYDVYVAGRCDSCGWADSRKLAIAIGRSSAAFICDSAIISMNPAESDRERGVR